MAPGFRRDPPIHQLSSDEEFFHNHEHHHDHQDEDGMLDLATDLALPVILRMANAAGLPPVVLNHIMGATRGQDEHWSESETSESEEETAPLPRRRARLAQAGADRLHRTGADRLHRTGADPSPPGLLDESVSSDASDSSTEVSDLDPPRSEGAEHITINASATPEDPYEGDTDDSESWTTVDDEEDDLFFSPAIAISILEAYLNQPDSPIPPATNTRETAESQTGIQADLIKDAHEDRQKDEEEVLESEASEDFKSNSIKPSQEAAATVCTQEDVSAPNVVETSSTQEVIEAVEKATSAMIPISFPFQAVFQEEMDSAAVVIEENINATVVREDAVKEAAVREDAVTDHAVKAAAVREDAVTDHAVKAAAVRDDAVKAAAVREDAVRDDAVKAAGDGTTYDSESVMEEKIKSETGEVLFSPPLYIQRYRFVMDRLEEEENAIGTIKSFVDIGCSECKFIQYFRNKVGTEFVYGVDIDKELLQSYSSSLKPLIADYLGQRKNPLDIELLCGSIEDCDKRLYKIDGVSAIELIEHLYPPQLQAFPKTVFGFMQPKICVITTPNIEYNTLFQDFQGPFRHWDHKFEWTRFEFESWCQGVTSEFPEYSVKLDGVGFPASGQTSQGPCSQIAVFTRDPSAEYRTFNLAPPKIVLEGAQVPDENRGGTLEEGEIEESGVEGEKELFAEVYESIVKHVFPFAEDTRSFREKVYGEALYASRNIALYLRREEEWVDSEVIPVKVSDMLEFTGLAELSTDVELITEVMVEGGEKVENGMVLVDFGPGELSEAESEEVDYDGDCELPNLVSSSDEEEAESWD